VDANNLWPTADEAIAFLLALDYPFHAVEEPIAPGRYAELAGIAAQLGCKVILDESFLRASQMDSSWATLAPGSSTCGCRRWAASYGRWRS
jgi:L-alanine-DL-glutamate epimerase-like enolase superfamily enzyme